MSRLEVDRRSLIKGVAALKVGSVLSRFHVHGASAQGSLSEINSGVAIGPAQSLVWRVVRDTAAPIGTGEEMERALGFLIANRNDVIVTSGGSSTLLTKGESHFIPEAEFERQESADDEPISYVRFGLVDPAEATFTAGGELLFGSKIQQFDGIGWFQLRLYKGRLSGEETVALPASAINGKVIYADRGSIAIVGVAADGSRLSHRQDLNPGEAWVPTIANDPPDHWEVIVAGEVENVTFYVATAEPTGGGDPPGTDAGGEGNGSQGMGQVNVSLYGCAAGVGGSTAAECNPLADVASIELESFESGLLFSLADANYLDTGMFNFDVPYGSYIVRAEPGSGELLRTIRIDGVPVQNPTVRVDDATPNPSIQIFFSV